MKKWMVSMGAGLVALGASAAQAFAGIDTTEEPFDTNSTDILVYTFGIVLKPVKFDCYISSSSLLGCYYISSQLIDWL